MWKTKWNDSWEWKSINSCRKWVSCNSISMWETYTYIHTWSTASLQMKAAYSRLPSLPYPFRVSPRRWLAGPAADLHDLLHKWQTNNLTQPWREHSALFDPCASSCVSSARSWFCMFCHSVDSVALCVWGISGVFLFFIYVTSHDSPSQLLREVYADRNHLSSRW